MKNPELLKKFVKIGGWFLAINIIMMVIFNSLGLGRVYNGLSFIQVVITLFYTLKTAKEVK